MKVIESLLVFLLCICMFNECRYYATSFSINSPATCAQHKLASPQSTVLASAKSKVSEVYIHQQIGNGINYVLTSAILVAALTVGSPSAFADEYGVETEAPTLFTGETVEICKRRGPLGACLETVKRTVENDNDKSDKYFSPVIKKKEDMQPEVFEGNSLIEKLRQQSVDNREKNDLQVKQITALNDQSASFGPFDRSVVIMNEDGKGFTLLENPQAMRLKKAGFIVDRRFVKQPTQQEIEDALVSDSPGFLKGLFGESD